MAERARLGSCRSLRVLRRDAPVSHGVAASMGHGCGCADDRGAGPVPRRVHRLFVMASVVMLSVASWCRVAAAGGCYYRSSSSGCAVVVAANSNCTSEADGGRAVTWLADAAASGSVTISCVVELQPSSFTLDMGTSELVVEFAPTAAGVLPANAFSGLTAAGDVSLSHGNVNRIQAGAFDGARLGGLYLSYNSLGVPPTHTFKGLTALYIRLFAAGSTRLEPYVFQGAVLTGAFTSGSSCLSLSGNDLGTVPAHAFSGLTCTMSSHDGASIYGGNASSVEPFAFTGLTITGTLQFGYSARRASVGAIRADSFSGLVARGLDLQYSGITQLHSYAFRGVSLSDSLELAFSGHVGVLPPRAFSGGVARFVVVSNAGITGISPGAFLDCSMCFTNSLDFAGNAIGTVVSNAFSGFQGKSVLLGEAGVQRVEPRAFNDCVVTGTVELGGTSTTLGVLPADAFFGPAAGTLDLNSAGITGITPGAFHGFRTTGFVDIGGNSVGVLRPRTFAGLQASYLMLENTGVTEVQGSVHSTVLCFTARESRHPTT